MIGAGYARTVEEGEDLVHRGVLDGFVEIAVEEEVIVGADFEGLVVGIVQEEASSDDGSLVGNAVGQEKEPGADLFFLGGVLDAQNALVQLVLHGEAEDVHLGLLFQGLEAQGGALWGIEGIAGVDEEAVFSGGVLDALVHGIVDAGVGFGEEDHLFPVEALHEFHAAILGGPVNDDPLEFLALLSQDGACGQLQPVQVISVDGDDGQLHGMRVSVAWPSGLMGCIPGLWRRRGSRWRKRWKARRKSGRRV